MSQLEKFGTYTQEAAAKARSEEATAGWLKLKGGTNVVRLLPPLVGMREPWVTVFQHFIKVPGGKQVVFNCPRRMENARCPACEKADRLKAAGDPASEAQSRDFWATQRNIAFAIDRDDPDKGAQMFPFGATIKKRLRHFMEKLGKNYTDFQEGYDIVIDRMGSGLDTEYQVDTGEQCAITGDMQQLEQWVADLPDLKSFAKVLPYDVIVEKFKTAGSPAQPQRRAVAAASSVGDDAGEVDDSDDAF